MSAQPTPAGATSAADVAAAALAALEDGKARDIVDLDVRQFNTGVFDRMIVCTVGSVRHGSTLADRVIDAVKEAGGRVFGSEGRPDSTWRLIDAGDVVVHVMTDEAREYYDIESLWAPIGA